MERANSLEKKEREKKKTLKLKINRTGAIDQTLRRQRANSQTQESMSKVLF